MRARIWGCRGSVAVPGPDTMRYGGNTSCVEVRSDDGTVLVLDAGTGIRALGARLAEEGHAEVHVLLSHLHLDHLQGLGFFRPLFDPDVHVHLWGPASPVRPLTDRIARYLSPPLFPVRLSEIPATLTFHDAPTAPVRIGGIEVVAAPVTHQGPTVGYRLEEGGRSLAYLSDHEPALGGPLDHREPEWVSGWALAHRADVLVHDAQYGDREYPDHVGWGHSAIEHVVAFAHLAEARSLLLFHHDPYHDDDDLDALLAQARALAADHPTGGHPDGALEVAMAVEGLELDLRPTPTP